MQVTLTDLSSLHGTYVLDSGCTQRKKLQANVPHKLRDGEKITLGKAVWKDNAVSRCEYSPCACVTFA